MYLAVSMLVLLSLIIVPSSIRAQNDAGSGGDAGDEFNAALQIAVGFYTGTLEGSDTQDWYKFPIDAGEVLNISMTSQFGADFDLKLFDSLGVEKDGSVHIGSIPEHVSFASVDSNMWYIRIFTSSSQGNYSFTIAKKTQDDAGSGGDAGNSMSSPMLVVPGGINGWLSPGDESDWYTLAVSSGYYINVDLIPPYDSDFDLSLLSSLGDEISKSIFKNGVKEYISHYADTTDDFCIKVSRIFGQGAYVLTISISTSSAIQDAENGGDAGNNFNVATLIAPNYYNGTRDKSMGDVDDYYRITLNIGKTLGVGGEITSGHNPSSAVIVEIYNPSGEEVASGWDIYHRKIASASYTADSSGDYRIHLWHLSNNISYRLAVFIYSQNDANNGGDAGDNYNTAMLLEPGHYWGLRGGWDTYGKEEGGDPRAEENPQNPESIISHIHNHISANERKTEVPRRAQRQTNISDVHSFAPCEGWNCGLP